MVTRESDGWVALQHRNSNAATVQMESDGTVYSFVPQHNVSLAWVNPIHVAQLLQVQAKICCGKTANKFEYASQTNVCLWETGNRC